jgi:L-ascorbate metabolism protein UlaG (beta-lactamase superfamily)
MPPNELVITRIAHATVLLDFPSARILTDPWFSERPGYKRSEPLGIPLEHILPLTGVVATHRHYDHFDLETFAAYPDRRVPFVVKRGMGEAAREAGFSDITELDPWERASVGAVKVTATPAKHVVPENTYVLEADGFTVFFGGDTLLVPELAEVARRFGRIDVALLPVNGLAIRPLLNRRIVMDPRDALELCRVLRPRIAIPIHYAFTGGPFRDRWLLKYNGTGADFAELARQSRAQTRVEVLNPGVPQPVFRA